MSAEVPFFLGETHPCQYLQPSKIYPYIIYLPTDLTLCSVVYISKKYVKSFAANSDNPDILHLGPPSIYVALLGGLYHSTRKLNMFIF